MIRDCLFVLGRRIYFSHSPLILLLQRCYCSEQFLIRLSVSLATYVSNVVIFITASRDFGPSITHVPHIGWGCSYTRGFVIRHEPGPLLVLVYY